jgi:hypothetical protein
MQTCQNGTVKSNTFQTKYLRILDIMCQDERIFIILERNLAKKISHTIACIIGCTHKDIRIKCGISVLMAANQTASYLRLFNSLHYDLSQAHKLGERGICKLQTVIVKKCQIFQAIRFFLFPSSIWLVTTSVWNFSLTFKGKN